jgi:hypothetical protein
MWTENRLAMQQTLLDFLQQPCIADLPVPGSRFEELCKRLKLLLVQQHSLAD